MKKPNGTAGIPILGQPKVNSPTATVADVERLLERALKKQDEIHNFYLQQIPTFVARMVQDALIGYGLIAMTPASDAPAQPETPSGDTTSPASTATPCHDPLVQ